MSHGRSKCFMHYKSLQIVIIVDNYIFSFVAMFEEAINWLDKSETTRDIYVIYRKKLNKFIKAGTGGLVY